MSSCLNCPICQDGMKNPKALPCLHSVCLKCMENYCNSQPNNRRMNCPICRRDFEMPPGGARCLPDNFFIKECGDGLAAAVDHLLQLEDIKRQYVHSISHINTKFEIYSRFLSHPMKLCLYRKSWFSFLRCSATRETMPESRDMQVYDECSLTNRTSLISASAIKYIWIYMSVSICWRLWTCQHRSAHSSWHSS